MSLSSSDVLFVGRGNTVVSWYRTGMPSLHLGCDWIGVIGKPPNLGMAGSLKRGGSSEFPDFEDYKIIILQQVSGRAWLSRINQLRAKGIRVYYEVDDYLHAVRKSAGHGSARAFSKKILAEHEMCMRVCDGLIVSTEWLGRRYLKFNKNVFVCTNSIETGRYKDLAPADRETVNIGWAGGEGHQQSSQMWIGAARRVMEQEENARFVSIGLPAAGEIHLPGRCLAIPFVSIEQFPAALCNFDLAIAPAMTNNFFAGKSDLRFLECGALGIPVIAHPFVYGKSIEDDVTGFLTDDVGEVEADMLYLVQSEEKRKEMGAAAKEWVLANRSIEKGIEQWERVFVST